MPSLSSFQDLRTYHMLAYGTLLGTNWYQTFIAGPFAYKALPRPSFATLQTAVTPPYFAIETVLPIVLAFTWPGDKLAGAAGSDFAIRRDAGFAGIMDSQNVWTALVPIGIVFGTSLLNWALLGPNTTKVMKQRKHQETRDGKKYYDPSPSEEMQRLNKSFMILHSASAFGNLAGLCALIYYGITLSERL